MPSYDHAVGILDGDSASESVDEDDPALSFRLWGPGRGDAPSNDRRHHCTDHVCLLVVFLTFLSWLYMSSYAVGHGNMVKVTHGRDIGGNICGLDIVDKPFVFWCVDSSGSPDHRVCVKSCPTEASSSAPFCAGDGSYATVPFLNRFCLPEEEVMYDQVKMRLHHMPGFHFIKEALGLKHNLGLIAAVVVLTVALGYAYLYVLKTMACYLIWCSIAVLVGACLGAGAFVLAHSGSVNEDFQSWAILFGLASLAAGATFSCLICCCRSKLDTAIGVVEATSECMWALPSLLLVPLLQTLLTCCSMSFLVYFFIYLLSVGNMQEATVENYAAAGTGGTMGKMYTDWEQQMILFYIFLLYWNLETLTALGQYVLAYMVGQWFFSPVNEEGEKAHVPKRLLLWGYATGLGFHLGSLAFGGFLVAVCRFVRMLVTYLLGQVQREGNLVAACVARIVFCCLSCVQSCIEFLSKNAYMDVAINSTSFCKAAHQAFMVITEAMAEMPILNGATVVFQLTGVLSITASSSALVYVAVTTHERFTDLRSAHHVADPWPVTILAGAVAFVVAFGFMEVFDMVADTLLYSFVFVRRSHPAEALKYLPEGELRDVLERYK